MKTDTKKKTFVYELESLLESEAVYNANVNILNCEINPEGEATGRFKDSWNGSNAGLNEILGRDPKYKKLIQQHPELKKDRSDSEIAALLRGYFDVRSL